MKKKGTQKEKLKFPLALALRVLAAAVLLLQIRWRNVFFPEVLSLLQFIRAGRVVKKRRKKDLGVSNTTYSNSQSDIAAALADFFDLAAPSKNKRQ